MGRAVVIGAGFGGLAAAIRLRVMGWDVTVLEALDQAPEGLTIYELTAVVNLSQARFQKTLDLISLESPSPLVKEGYKWQLTAAELSDEFWARAKRLSNLRRYEQFEMQEYVQLESGHMEYLIEALDGDRSAVRAPSLDRLPATPSRELVNEAIAFLRRSDVPLKPKQRWPPGGMPGCAATCARGVARSLCEKCLMRGTVRLAAFYPALFRPDRIASFSTV